LARSPLFGKTSRGQLRNVHERDEYPALWGMRDL
jgi:hypothetical protein